MSESLEEHVTKIRRAAYDQFCKPAIGGNADVWVRDVLTDSIIVQVGEDIFKIGYSIDSDGAVNFVTTDKWEKVELKYVSVKESKPYELADGVLTIYRTSEPVGPYAALIEKQFLESQQ